MKTGHTEETGTAVEGGTFPLGATLHGGAVQFAVGADNADAIDLCLFTAVDDAVEQERIPLTRTAAGGWTATVEGLQPGQLYGYRVSGPYRPSDGHRFNPRKLLVDPCARAIAGSVRWDGPVYGYTPGHPDEDLSCDERDSAGYIPKAAVIDDRFDWGDDRPPNVPWAETLIYECHVKGLTQCHPDVAPPFRGRFGGLAAPPVIAHLRALGVTALELLPVQHSISRAALIQRGLVNYWGYDPIGFTAPDARFASGDRGQQVTEFKSMVKALHAAGIEVILDVVFNHTAEGDRLGPTILLRGLDNAAYHRLDPRNPRDYEDFTGCGHCLQTAHPLTLRMIMDSLRYWVQQMHVDGFRFDLTATLIRNGGEPTSEHPLLKAIADDPVVSRVKLIAEPWDIGPGGYQLGAFPQGWPEWNDRYRDTARRFWRGDGGQVAGLACRLSGSSDYFARTGRSPHASINFITAHDGFTLRDLVSYRHRHNDANGEHNRDGHAHEISSNRGIEGPTHDPAVRDVRERLQRSLLATLAVSLGIPMITAGDEMGRTQHGNNNAYCQDNETSWVHWELDDRSRGLLLFTRRLWETRRRIAALRRGRFFTGTTHCECGLKDVAWLRPDGMELGHDDWNRIDGRFLGMLIHRHPEVPAAGGKRSAGPETILAILNGGSTMVTSRLPVPGIEGRWVLLWDTADATRGPAPVTEPTVPVTAHSHLLFELQGAS